jgi:hypothetical protein
VFRYSGQMMNTQAGCLRNQHGKGNLLTSFSCASNLDDDEKWSSVGSPEGSSRLQL